MVPNRAKRLIHTSSTLRLILNVALSSVKVYSWKTADCTNARACTSLPSSTVNFKPFDEINAVAT